MSSQAVRDEGVRPPKKCCYVSAASNSDEGQQDVEKREAKGDGGRYSPASTSDFFRSIEVQKSAESKSAVNILHLLPSHTLLLVCEFLFVKDLLEVGTVSNFFLQVSRNELLWKRLACHLWRAALIGRMNYRVETSLARLEKIEGGSTSRVGGETSDTDSNLTFQDICRCMVGIWPTHIDVSDGPPLHLEHLQCIVGGALLPVGTPPSPVRATSLLSPLRSLRGRTLRCSTMLHEGLRSELSPEESPCETGQDGRADSVSGHPASPAAGPRRRMASTTEHALATGGPQEPSPSRVHTGPMQVAGAAGVVRAAGASAIASPPGALCTGVVFRGRLGGDRAVRSDLPFPWMDNAHARGAWTLVHGASGEPHSVKTENCPGKLSHLSALVCRVRSDSPFAMLWPGVSSVGHRASSSSATRDARAYADGSLRDGMIPVVSAKDAVSSTKGMEGQQLISSGPYPFFRAGYIAYFEVTLGESMGPSDRIVRRGGSLVAHRHRVECIGIGLSTSQFRLCRRQVGWDKHSWGLHSDDGLYFHDSVTSDHMPSRIKFGPGDTIGCALVYPPLFGEMVAIRLGASGQQSMIPGHSRYVPPSGTKAEALARRQSEMGIFFTKNGAYQGLAFRNVPPETPLFPTISLDSHCPMEVNFGAKPFLFDLPAFEADVRRQILSSNIPQLHDQAAAIREPSKAGTDVVNPRLLFPYLRFDEDSGGDDQVGRHHGGSISISRIENESQALRRALRRRRRRGLSIG